MSRLFTLAPYSRREFLRRMFLSAGALSAPAWLAAYGSATPPASNGARASRFSEIGPLGEPDENGLRLPQGFSSRVLAVSGEPAIAGKSYIWHRFPDGSACYPLPDGGWIYTSNSEVPAGGGGCGALRFDRDGNPADAYSILSGTSGNCAGGKTPWPDGTRLYFSAQRNGRNGSLGPGITFEVKLPFSACPSSACP